MFGFTRHLGAYDLGNDPFDTLPTADEYVAVTVGDTGTVHITPV